jgi:glycine oxidase
MKADVVIIGGGVIGLSIARELRRRGAGRVAVVDRRKVGQESSFAAAGMLAPGAESEGSDAFYDLCAESRDLFPGFAASLLAETSVDIELDRTGTLYTAFSAEDVQHLEAKLARLKDREMAKHLLRDETLELEPSLSSDLRESVLFPGDWQVENRRLMTALKTFADANDIDLLEGSEVDGLDVNGRQVIGVRTGEELISADNVIVAAGAWTSSKLLGFRSPITPVRGQMIAFRGPVRRLRHVVYSPRGYLVPRSDGRVLAGATSEDAGFEKRVSATNGEMLAAAAIEMAPFLSAETVVETWAGLRPFASDGFPVIGEVPGIHGLTVATGHYRNGILLAPLTAKLIADLVLGGSTSKYFETFGPERFSPASVVA